MTHMTAQPHSRRLKGHGLKEFLKPQSIVIEKCGRLAGISEASRDRQGSMLGGDFSFSNVEPLNHPLAEGRSEADPIRGSVLDGSSFSTSSTLDALLDPDIEISVQRGTSLPADPPHQAVVEPGLLTGAYLFDTAASVDNNATAVSDGQRLPPNLKRERSVLDLYDPLFEGRSRMHGGE